MELFSLLDIALEVNLNVAGGTTDLDQFQLSIIQTLLREAIQRLEKNEDQV